MYLLALFSSASLVPVLIIRGVSLSLSLSSISSLGTCVSVYLSIYLHIYLSSASLLNLVVHEGKDYPDLHAAVYLTPCPGHSLHRETIH